MKTTLKIVAGIAIFFFFIYLGAYMMSPGSYSRAEYYRVDIPGDQIIEKVAEFKEKYPEYKYTRTDRNGKQYIYMEDEPDFFYVHLPTLDITVSCVLKNNEECRIGLDYANGESIPERGARLNSGKIPRKLNQRIKKVFEKEILPKLGEWDHYVNAFLRFFGVN